MNRLDDLTLRLADGELTDDETAELRLILAQDSEAQRRHVLLLELEGRLRGGDCVTDVAPAVMQTVQAGHEDRVVGAVMKQIGTRAAPARRASRMRVLDRRVLSWRAGLAAAAALLIVALGLSQLRRPPLPMAPPTAVPAFASVLRVSGPATVLRGAERVAVVAGAALTAGDRLETGAGAQLTVTWRGATRVTLAPDTELTLDADATRERFLDLSARALHVARGAITADVAPQPAGQALAFVTPHARAIVVGTRLWLRVAEAETRLEVAEGRVIFERFAGGSTIEIAAGSFALATPPIVSADDTPAPDKTKPRRRPDDEDLASIPVLGFDFEDGVLPPRFTSGLVVQGPARPGNRFALQGTLNFYGPETNTIAVTRGNDLFTYSDTQVIGFDYFVGSDARRMVVQMWNPGQQQNYDLVFTDLVRDGWGHAELRLSDFKPVRFAQRHFEDGDRIGNVYIMAGRMVGQPFYVDNIQIVDMAPEKLPKHSAGGGVALPPKR
jgi:ferric-dicitrate binding protein FerR (iron transport regulator)